MGGQMLALKNVLFRLVIPTILFSTIIYIPKVIFHSGGLRVMDYLVDVFGGISYWFTSALAVAQILLLSAMLLVRQKGIWSYLLISAVFFAIGFTLNTLRTDTESRAFLPWFYQTGLEYTLVMAGGGLYYRYEQIVDKWIRRFWFVPLFMFIAILAWAYLEGYTLKMMGLGGQLNSMGALAMCCGVAAVAAVCKHTRPMVWLTWIGRNSIVFYFFSGVFPAMVSTVMLRFCPIQAYPLALVTTSVAILLGTMTTCIVNRFAPFMIDLRKIVIKNKSNDKEFHN